jgi:hypothetical protein
VALRQALQQIKRDTQQSSRVDMLCHLCRGMLSAVNKSFMLNVFMLTVVMLSVVMLNVVAPKILITLL